MKTKYNYDQFQKEIDDYNVKLNTIETQNNDLLEKISILNNERIKKEKKEKAFIQVKAISDVKLVYAKDFTLDKS